MPLTFNETFQKGHAYNTVTWGCQTHQPQGTRLGPQTSPVHWIQHERLVQRGASCSACPKLATCTTCSIEHVVYWPIQGTLHAVHRSSLRPMGSTVDQMTGLCRPDIVHGLHFDTFTLNQDMEFPYTKRPLSLSVANRICCFSRG